jgi:hypothetical protein
MTLCLAYYYIHCVDEDDADVAGVSEDAESDAEGTYRYIERMEPAASYLIIW